MMINGVELSAVTIGDVVAERAALGDRLFITIGDNDTLTFRELHERSDAIAAGLQAEGVQHGDTVATFMHNSTDHVLIWFAAAKIGAIWVPLNVSFQDEDLRYTVADARARVIVVDAELWPVYARARAGLKESLPALSEYARGAVDGIRGLAELGRADAAPSPVIVEPSDAACITYTGGSTGMPKGVLLPHLMFIAAGLRYQALTQATVDDVHFSNGQLFHIGGQQLGVFGPLYNRMSAVMVKWFSASQYWARARAGGATIIDPVGPMLSAIVAQPRTAQDREHRVRMGIGIGSGQVSRSVRDEFVERYGVELYEVYGQTETGVLLCSETPDVRRVGSSGHPDAMGWADIRVADEYDHDVPVGAEGRILLRPRVPYAFMLGYFHKHPETVQAWRNLWFHTGDLGRLDQDGFLYFTGREAHWIRRRGENVSAFEVEQVLAQHRSVLDCAVVGVPAELGEEDIKAYLQLHPGSTLDPGEVVNWCRERLSYFKVPRYVEFVDDFPRSNTKSEIQRHLLRDRGIGDAWDAGERRPTAGSGVGSG